MSIKFNSPFETERERGGTRGRERIDGEKNIERKSTCY
jgi:hypothetical protein